ncbi:MAG TPA: hypothetical protein PKC21_03765 [Oligoflexia bacterium]|nr:hypothetical protein [Oligoflexia bacterium]HMR24454.1 hypothetical protein [Oligoflexia bacterium]
MAFVKKSVCFLIVILMISSSTLKAESFKGGRDIAMVSAGMINLSLLIMVIHQSSKKNKKPSIKKPIPLNSNTEQSTKNTP